MIASLCIIQNPIHRDSIHPEEHLRLYLTLSILLVNKSRKSNLQTQHLTQIPTQDRRTGTSKSRNSNIASRSTTELKYTRTKNVPLPISKNTPKLLQHGQGPKKQGFPPPGRSHVLGMLQMPLHKQNWRQRLQVNHSAVHGRTVPSHTQWM